MDFSKIGKSNSAPVSSEPLPKQEPKIKLTLKPSINLQLRFRDEVKVTQQVNVWDGNPIATKDIPEFTYPFEYLNPVQSEFYVNRFLDSNFIISAKTSAGKTVIAELAKNGKLLYLSPLKAISQEKMDDWTSSGHAWHNLNVSISTGDYSLTPDRVEEMRKADVIVMTSEMLDSRTRSILAEKNDWLRKIDTLVIDEFHLIGYKGRGDKLESALMRFTKQNPNCRLVCLSATMPNIHELGEWLTILNGKQTTIINSDYRPVKLNRHYTAYQSFSDYNLTQQQLMAGAINAVRERPNDKFIVFTHTKNTGYALQDMMRANGIPCEFHNADLSKEDRINLQTQFNSKDKSSLRVLIATSTLAWGVNTPADSVVLMGIHRGKQLIENQDIHQMCGRAGRVGMTDKPEGNAYILLPHNSFPQFQEWCERILDVKSKMNILETEGIDTLCFHVISEVLNKDVVNAKTLSEWYERSLARHQGISLDEQNAQLVLDKLVELKMIRFDETNQTYYGTGLGKVSAYLYYSPFDIYSWYRNFQRLFNNEIPENSATISWAIANTAQYNLGYIPTQAQTEASIWNSRVNRFSLDGQYVAHIGATYYQLLEGAEPFPYALMPYKRQVQGDFERIELALKLIDSYYGRWDKEQLWNRLKTQVRYGVKPYLLPLVELPQIGPKRAQSLYSGGIKNKDDFKAKASLARAIIGNRLYDIIIQSL